MAKKLRTAKAIREYLAAKGFILERRLEPYTCGGREMKGYWFYIKNFRGGRCFRGGLEQLIEHVNTTAY